MRALKFLFLFLFYCYKTYILKGTQVTRAQGTSPLVCVFHVCLITVDLGGVVREGSSEAVLQNPWTLAGLCHLASVSSAWVTQSCGCLHLPGHFPLVPLPP